MDGMKPTQGGPQFGIPQNGPNGEGQESLNLSDPRLIHTANQLPHGPSFEQKMLAGREATHAPGQPYLGPGAEVAGKLRQNQQMHDHAHLMANVLQGQQQLVQGMPAIQNYGNLIMGSGNVMGNAAMPPIQNPGFNIGYNGPLHSTGPINTFPIVGSCPRPVLQAFFQPVCALPANYGANALGLISQQLSIATGLMMQCMQNINALAAGGALNGFSMGQLPMVQPFDQVNHNINWMAGAGAPAPTPMYCYPQAMPMGAPAGSPFAHFYFAPAPMAPSMLQGMCPLFNQMPLQQMPGWNQFAANFGAFVPPGGYGPMQGAFQGPEIEGRPPWDSKKIYPAGGENTSESLASGHEPSAKEGIAENQEKQTSDKFKRLAAEFVNAYKELNIEKLRTLIPVLKSQQEAQFILGVVFLNAVNKGNSPEVIQCFIDAGFDLNKEYMDVDKSAKTPLLSAVSSMGDQSSECIKLLLDNGARLDETNLVDLLVSADQVFERDGVETRCPDSNIEALVNLKGAQWFSEALKGAGVTNSDFGHPAIKSLFLSEGERIKEDARAAHQDFMASCQFPEEGAGDKGSRVTEIRQAHDILKTQWQGFDLNTDYEEKGKPLNWVLGNNLPIDEKVAAIRFLRSAGADNPCESYDTLADILPEEEYSPDDMRLCWAALTAPKGSDIKYYPNASSHVAVQFKPDQDRYAEGTDKDQQLKRWLNQEHRPSRKMDENQLDAHFVTKLEKAKTLQKKDELDNLDRDRGYVNHSNDAKPVEVGHKPKRKDDHSPLYNVAALPREGQSKKDIDLDKVHLNKTINVDGHTYQLAGLCDPQGESGYAVAAFVSRELPKALEKRLEKCRDHSESNTRDALKWAMVDVDRMIAKDKKLSKATTSGISGSFVMTEPPESEGGDTKIWTANFGDAETMLVRADGSADQLTLPTETHRGLGFSSLGVSKSARPSVGMIKLNPEQLSQSFLVTMNGAQRKSCSPQAVADLYGKKGSITAKAFATSAVREGGLLLVRPLSGKSELPERVMGVRTITDRLELLKKTDGQYDPETIDELYGEIGEIKGAPEQRQALESLYLALHKTDPDYAGGYPDGMADEMLEAGSCLPDLLAAKTMDELQKAHQLMVDNKTESDLVEQVYVTQRVRLISQILTGDRQDEDETWNKQGFYELHRLMDDYPIDAPQLTVEHLTDSPEDAGVRSLIKSLKDENSRLRQCADPDQLERKVTRLLPERRMALQAELEKVDDSVDNRTLTLAKGRQEKDALKFAAIYEQVIDKLLSDYKNIDGKELARQAGNETDFRVAFMAAQALDLLPSSDEALENEFNEGLEEVRKLEAEQKSQGVSEQAATPEPIKEGRLHGIPVLKQGKARKTEDNQPAGTKVSVSFSSEELTSKPKEKDNRLFYKIADFFEQGGSPLIKVKLQGQEKTLLSAMIAHPDDQVAQYFMDCWDSADAAQPDRFKALVGQLEHWAKQKSGPTEDTRKLWLMEKLKGAGEHLAMDYAAGNKSKLHEALQVIEGAQLPRTEGMLLSDYMQSMAGKQEKMNYSLWAARQKLPETREELSQQLLIIGQAAEAKNYDFVLNHCHHLIDNLDKFIAAGLTGEDIDNLNEKVAGWPNQDGKLDLVRTLSDLSEKLRASREPTKVAPPIDSVLDFDPEYEDWQKRNAVPTTEFRAWSVRGGSFEDVNKHLQMIHEIFDSGHYDKALELLNHMKANLAEYIKIGLKITDVEKLQSAVSKMSRNEMQEKLYTILAEIQASEPFSEALQKRVDLDNILSKFKEAVKQQRPDIVYKKCSDIFDKPVGYFDVGLRASQLEPFQKELNSWDIEIIKGKLTGEEIDSFKMIDEFGLPVAGLRSGAKRLALEKNLEETMEWLKNELPKLIDRLSAWEKN